MATDTVVDVSEPKTLAERLRSAREARGLKVNELNRLVRLPGGRDLSVGYISRVESGDRSDIEAVYANAIADALGVRAEWLITGTGPRKFGSGEMPAALLTSTPKPNLDHVLAKMNRRGRWTTATVAAAKAQDVDVAAAEWPDILDCIQTGLAPAIKRLTR